MRQLNDCGEQSGLLHLPKFIVRADALTIGRPDLLKTVTAEVEV